MIEVAVTESMLEQAHSWTHVMGQISGSLKPQSRGVFDGHLGIVAVLSKVKNTEFVPISSGKGRYYNILWHDGRTAVRSKLTSVYPEPLYTAFVDTWDKLPEYYIFTRVHTNYKKVWIMGYLIAPQSFVTDPRWSYHSKGSADPTDQNFKYPKNCWSIQYRDCTEFLQEHINV
jgi:hypothetical protein